MIIVGADARHDRALPLEGRRRLRRGPQVHLERRQGLQPERDVVQGQVRDAKGASIVIYFGHGNGWPSPYTYDPKYTTKDGFGLNASGRARRQQHQVLRRALRLHAGPRPERGRPAAPPVLRVGQLGARRRRAERQRPHASASTTTPPASSRPARRPSSPTAMASPEPYIRAPVHDPCDDRGGLAERPELPRPRDARSPRPGRRARRPSPTRTRRPERLLPLAGRDGPASRPTRSPVPTYADTGDRPDGTRRARQRRGRRTAGGGLYDDDALTPDRERRSRPSRTAGVRLRRSPRPRDHRGPGPPPSASRASTTRRSTAGCRAADLVPATAAAPRIWGVDTGGGRFSPNGDDRFDRARERAVLRDRSTGGSGSSGRRHGPPGADRHRRRVRRDLGRARRRRRVPDGTYTCHDPRRGRLGEQPGDEDRHDPSRHGPGRTRPSSPAAGHRPWFAPNGDALARSRLVDGHDGRARFPRRCASSTATATKSVERRPEGAPGGHGHAGTGEDDGGTSSPDGLYEIRITRATRRDPGDLGRPAPSVSTPPSDS